MINSGKALAVALPLCALLAPAVGHAQTLTTIYNFTGGADGGEPAGALLYHGGLFYGTTIYGGSSDEGTVFTLDPASGTETAIYSFAGGADGATPGGNLIYQDGELFGTTSEGGLRKGAREGYGTVYELELKNLTETVLYRFGNGKTDGLFPYGGVIYNSGILYGTTNIGGANYAGTVFAVDPATQTETLLHSFGRHAGGSDPFGTLLYNGGLLYGTTSQGGEKNAGTIFTFDVASSSENTLYNFPKTGANGARPFPGVIYHGGSIYGVTCYGGASDDGTVFKLDPVTGSETVLYNFTGGADGSRPSAALMYSHGILYGTTAFGPGGGCGGSGCGSVFAVNAKTGAETTLYSFTGGADGGIPGAPLVLQAGVFYGVTQSGGGGTGCGGSGCGTAFSLTLRR
jgi:uncharacterized repeat protein (TIGR03803 family)